MVENQNNNKNYYIFMKIRPLIGRRIRIGRRLHVNQPLQLGVRRCGSVFPVCRYVLTIISNEILDKCDETSLAVTHIAVSVTFK